ncbi:MAG: ABC transporter permease [Rhodanobacteraceae bacterium]|nr:ABC transporter permease [Rhodanobacteraceae bacterium]
MEAHPGLHHRGDPHLAAGLGRGRVDVHHRLRRAAGPAALRAAGSAGQHRSVRGGAAPDRTAAGRLHHIPPVREQPDRDRLLPNRQHQRLDGRRQRRRKHRRDLGDGIDVQGAASPAIAWTLLQRRRGVREGPNAVILSESEWRSRYNAATDILGKTLIVNNAQRQIVGVMPEAFSFPTPATRVWLPVKLTDSGTVEDFSYTGVARLAPGATISQVQSELAAALPRMAGCSRVCNRVDRLRPGSTRRSSGRSCCRCLTSSLAT